MKLDDSGSDRGGSTICSFEGFVAARERRGARLSMESRDDVPVRSPFHHRQATRPLSESDVEHRRQMLRYLESGSRG